jgi:phosphohistidine phosphatase SixA
MNRPDAAVLELCVLRHAHAGDAATWDGDDDVRPLTEKGRRQAARLGHLLAAAGFAPDAVLTSPLARARETADIVADLLGVQARLDDRLAEPLDLGTLDAILHDAGSPHSPLLVGHDPACSEIVSELVGAPILMRKGALARVDVEGALGEGVGELRWLLPPDLLRG